MPVLYLFSFLRVAHGVQDGVVPIAAAGLGIEMNKVPDFSGILRDRLQVEVIAVLRTKTLLVFDLHRTKCTTVGIDTDEEFVLRLHLFQFPCRISYSSSPLLLPTFN